MPGGIAGSSFGARLATLAGFCSIRFEAVIDGIEAFAGHATPRS